MAISDTGYEWNDNIPTIRSSVYSEVGLGKNWTGIGKLDAKFERRHETTQQFSGQIGLRRQLLNRGIVLGGEVSTLIKDNLVGCGEYGAEIRLSSGRGFDKGFAVLEAATRYYGSDCLRYKLDATLGVNLLPRLQGIGKAFLEFDNEQLVSAKLEALLYLRLTQSLLFGLGYRREIGGLFREETAFMSIMQTF